MLNAYYVKFVGVILTDYNYKIQYPWFKWFIMQRHKTQNGCGM
jgi:hypothetical protein